MNKCKQCEGSVKNKYCNASCQMKWEYANGTRNKKTIVKAAHKAVKQKIIDRWNDGTYSRYVSKRGYKIISTPIGKMREHHYVWLRDSDWHFIPRGFVVHHINCDKLDNHIENLMCLPEDVHLAAHYTHRKINEKGQFIVEVQ